MSVQPSGRYAESLAFDLDWVRDPIPIWLVSRLDDRILSQLAVNQLETHRAMLQSQRAQIEVRAKATDNALNILREAVK